MVKRAMISRQLKRGELYDWLLKLCQCTILSLFRFWFWSSRLIWIFCTLCKFSLYDKYLLKINARQPIEEMLKIKDKNTVQNSGLFWRWYILPVKSSASVFSNDPISMIISYIFNFQNQIDHNRSKAVTQDPSRYLCHKSKKYVTYIHKDRHEIFISGIEMFPSKKQ